MNLLECREDLRVVLKVLKKELRQREKVSHEIKKVNEFNQICREMKMLEMSIDLLHTTLWMLRIE